MCMARRSTQESTGTDPGECVATAEGHRAACRKLCITCVRECVAGAAGSDLATCKKICGPCVTECVVSARGDDPSSPHDRAEA
eukprot:gene17618-11946_t